MFQSIKKTRHISAKTWKGACLSAFLLWQLTAGRERRASSVCNRSDRWRRLGRLSRVWRRGRDQRAAGAAALGAEEAEGPQLGGRGVADRRLEGELAAAAVAAEWTGRPERNEGPWLTAAGAAGVL